VPDGLIANLSGPYEGKRHDSTMLHQSGLLPLLEQHAFYNGVPLSLYGDPAYPLGVHLQGPFKDRHPTPEMGLFNKAMNSVRVSVEWMFGSICNYFAFIDMKKQQKINLSAIGKTVTLFLHCFKMPIHVYMETLRPVFFNCHLPLWSIISREEQLK
jgi:hypothetical protein